MNANDARSTAETATKAPPRIVIVGAGFAGLEAAKALGRADLPVTLVDRQNHHLFQPLLYQVATAALSAADVGEPIRKVLRRYRSVQVLMGEVARIDTRARRVLLADGEALDYDYLLIASGSTHGYFGHGEWRRHAPGLKTLADARHMRARLLLAFERAERTADPAEQARLMTTAIVGGGPTGVELAGSLAELSRHTLVRDFRNIAPETARIMLIEAGPRLLPGFSEESARYARERLERLGVEVRLDEAVEGVEARSITCAGETIPVGQTLWAAGVSASPLCGMLGVETDKGGRVPVDAQLMARGLERVFVIGDAARFEGADGAPLPGLAQVAKQEGRHLGRSLAKHLKEGAALEPFTYRSRGDTAIVGRNAAVFERGRLRLRGWFAWAAWAVIHIYLLVGFEHRMVVSLQWLWRYLTYERGARLVTEDAIAGVEEEPVPPRGKRKRKSEKERASPG